MIELEVIWVSEGLAVPMVNSAAAPDAVRVSPAPGVVGATFIVNTVAEVMPATVALFASPAPPSAIPIASPAVLSQVTLVLAAVVVQLVRVAPATVKP